jgi:hypothetical protein
MKIKILFPFVPAILVGASFAFAQTNTGAQAGQTQTTDERSPVELPQEKHLRNVRQLTDGGENAEA